MTLLFRLLVFSSGLVLFLIVFELVRTKRFREELSIVWLLAAMAIMLGSVADFIVDPVAEWLGVHYPPSLLFAWIIFCLILTLLYFSVILSKLKSRVKELSQAVALMEAALHDQKNNPPADHE